VLAAIVGLRPWRGSSWPGGKPGTGWGARLAAVGRALVRSPAASPLVRNEILSITPKRPACGDAPMRWKEQYTVLGGGLKWLGSRPVTLLLSVAFGCCLFDVAWPMVASALYGRVYDGPRLAMNAAIRQTSAVLGVLAILAVAASAADSLTSEREQDTW